MEEILAITWVLLQRSYSMKAKRPIATALALLGSFIDSLSLTV